VLGGLATFARRGGRSLAVFSDRLNHASIIDGIRGQRADVAHLGLFDHRSDLDDLRQGLASAPVQAIPVIITDGVFSMEGDQAPLSALRKLAEQFGALLIVDDSHGTGVVGARGRGTAEAQDLLGRVDVITGTLGKALGGAIGGFVAGPERLTAALRAVSRPYTFSTSPPPSVVAAALAALDVLAGPATPLPTLRARVHHLRTGIAALGLPALPGDHPIVPLVVGDETIARAMSADMISQGVFATALTFPVVPRGHARLRLQVSATNAEEVLDRVLAGLSDAHRSSGMRSAS
jgi:glycine C-acetyltransferase